MTAVRLPISWTSSIAIIIIIIIIINTPEREHSNTLIQAKGKYKTQ